MLGFKPRAFCAGMPIVTCGKKGIAVRRFPSVSFQDYLRITIGRMEELEAVANALEEFLQSNER